MWRLAHSQGKYLLVGPVKDLDPKEKQEVSIQTEDFTAAPLVFLAPAFLLHKKQIDTQQISKMAVSKEELQHIRKGDLI